VAGLRLEDFFAADHAGAVRTRSKACTAARSHTPSALRQRRSGAPLLTGHVRGKSLTAVRTAAIVLGAFRSGAAHLDDLGDSLVRWANGCAPA
jgi:hypothetical protein